MPIFSLSCRTRLAMGKVVAAVALVFASVLHTFLGSQPASAVTCPINVASYGHTLAAAQSALRAVSGSCHTIVFPAGTYTFSGQFRIGVGSVTVTGQPGALIQPAPGASFHGGLVQVHAAGVTVTGLTVAGSPDKGIEVSGSTNFTISSNVVHDSHSLGVHVLRSTTGTLSSNTIYRNRSNGMDIHGSKYITIQKNRSYLNGGPRFPDRNEGNGIIVYCSQDVKVLYNTVWDNAQSQPGGRDGIRISDNNQANGEMPTRYIIVDGNLAYDNQSRATQAWAIRIGGPSGKGGDLNYITVTNNTGYGNTEFGLYTKGLAPGAKANIANNKLT